MRNLNMLNSDSAHRYVYSSFIVFVYFLDIKQNKYGDVKTFENDNLGFNILVKHTLATNK